MKMANLKSKFKIFCDIEWKVTQPKFGSRPAISRPLVYCIERWATIIVRRQAVTLLNASFHVGDPLTKGALRPAAHGPHS